MCFNKSINRVSFVTSVLLGLGLSCVSATAAPLPPSGGPPAPVLAKVNIVGPDQFDEGTVASYSCIATYSDGTTAPVDPLWNVDSVFATIDTDGVLTAGDVLNDEYVTISVSHEGQSASATVLISFVAPVLNGLTISGPTAVDEEQSATYTCSASYSDGSTVSVVPSWSVSSASAAIDAGGVLAAGSVNADEDVDVIASFDGMTKSFTVSIVDIPVVLLDIIIQGAAAMDENSSVQVNCVAVYSDGSQPLVQPDWEVSSSVVQIGQTGLLTAGNITSDQGVTVSASFDGQSDTHSVLIRYVAPNLERIEVFGPSSVNEGASADYSCVAYYDDETSKGVAPVWSEDSSYASMSSSGQLTASDVQSDQTVMLSASYEGKSNSKQVTIVYDVPTIVSLSIDGASVVEELNETRYTCSVAYSDGTSGSVAPVWSVDQAWSQIDQNGWLQVGEVVRDELVTVTASYGGASDTFEVLLKDVPPPVLLQRLSVSGASEVMERESIALVCEAHYSDGTSRAVTPVWSDDSAVASVSVDGDFAAGNFESDAVVEVTASYGGFTATHQVSVWAIGTEIIYPLSGFDGRVVTAELYDNKTGEWRDFGPFESPEALVLDEMGTNQWYWVSVLESNTTSNVWVEVQGNWLNM